MNRARLLEKVTALEEELAEVKAELAEVKAELLGQAQAANGNPDEQEAAELERELKEQGVWVYKHQVKTAIAAQLVDRDPKTLNNWVNMETAPLKRSGKYGSENLYCLIDIVRCRRSLRRVLINRDARISLSRL